MVNRAYKKRLLPLNVLYSKVNGLFRYIKYVSKNHLQYTCKKLIRLVLI